MALCGPHSCPAGNQPGQIAHTGRAAHPRRQGRARDPVRDLLQYCLPISAAQQVSLRCNALIGSSQMDKCILLWVQQS